MIVYGPADAIATLSSLAPVKSRMVYLSGASLPGCSGKMAIKRMLCSMYVVFSVFTLLVRQQEGCPASVIL